MYSSQAKLIGAEYKGLSDEQMEKYNAMAKEDKERYKKEMAEYEPPAEESKPKSKKEKEGKKKAKEIEEDDDDSDDSDEELVADSSDATQTTIRTKIRSPHDNRRTSLFSWIKFIAGVAL